jgi:hypothetical protein
MIDHTLNKLVGTAIIDEDFGALLLANPRATAQRFGLGTEELEAVASIHASTLSEFAQQLDEWMLQRNHRRNGGNGHRPQRPVPEYMPALTMIGRIDFTASIGNN